MNVYLDTDVLIAATVQGHPHHKQVTVELRKRGVGPNDLRASLHSSAEVYSTLTKSALPYGGTPQAVARMVSSLLGRIAFLPLGEATYQRALGICSQLDIPRAGIYDALHVAAAEQADCDTLFTMNVKHFDRMKLATSIPFVYPERL